jgi:hypothetical protein
MSKANRKKGVLADAIRYFAAGRGSTLTDLIASLAELPDDSEYDRIGLDHGLGVAAAASSASSRRLRRAQSHRPECAAGGADESERS